MTAAHAEYAGLRDMLASKGYEVVPVEILWNRTTMSEFVDKFVEFYERHKGAYNVVLGSSFGAMAAFISAPRTKPDQLILCSLSPFFKEDLAKANAQQQRQVLRMVGKRRLANFKTLSADDIAMQVNATNTPALMLYGEEEKTAVPHLVVRVKDTAAKLNTASLHEIPGAPHSMRHPAYTAGIAKVLDIGAA
jgi:hypothetical protein